VTPQSERPGEYVVVARRYRPQLFEQLIGQEHIAKGLTSAIQSNRVGHAYLFTGARGVGKTSAARIFAKALNCQTGPTITPCGECDLCQSVAAGSDVDVLEIDGASNRGIDEIRQLRQNVGVRPSRARFKIYIIDEVHMLTKEAFNALLKTLEEPPEHVKFIFCTTEANKIPITILSRCQRFDFAGIRSQAIITRLSQIVAEEGGTAEPAALASIARRAAGSMRDSQSLLEQLLAFGTKEITLAQVHSLLGTADEAQVMQLLVALAQQNGAAALQIVDQAALQGVDIGQLLEQLLGTLRDCMVLAVGGPVDVLAGISNDDVETARQIANQWGLETILASMQILEQAIYRLRFSTQPRTVAELALVRIATLENLLDLNSVSLRVESGSGALPAPTAAAPIKKNSLEVSSERVTASQSAPPQNEAPAAVPQTTPLASPADLTGKDVTQIWRQGIALLGDDILGHNAANASKVTLTSSAQANSAPNRLVIAFPARYNFAKVFCERPDQLPRIEQVVGQIAGGTVKLEFVFDEAAAPETPVKNERKSIDRRNLVTEASGNPLVQKALEVFDATVVHVEPATKQNS
jgi:DNA polymerase-3 subunit gamma/tau